ncbi:hypothetical protein RRG08_041902 [Elysia crispata]|uniref:Uncharacterized protein n=1 Tax=Elysia crispata TaxID=231223 RepID=A0AAE0ZEU2_9GAST|nr:hypothetical protein RRG08_041902 [Elysia crispata]
MNVHYGKDGAEEDADESVATDDDDDDDDDDENDNDANDNDDEDDDDDDDDDNMLKPTILEIFSAPTAPGFPPGSAGRAHTGAKFRSGDLTERILFDQPYPPPDGGFEVLVTAEDAMALVISIESGVQIMKHCNFFIQA